MFAPDGDFPSNLISSFNFLSLLFNLGLLNLFEIGELYLSTVVSIEPEYVSFLVEDTLDTFLAELSLYVTVPPAFSAQKVFPY